MGNVTKHGGKSNREEDDFLSPLSIFFHFADRHSDRHSRHSFKTCPKVPKVMTLIALGFSRLFPTLLSGSLNLRPGGGGDVATFEYIERVPFVGRSLKEPCHGLRILKS